MPLLIDGYNVLFQLGFVPRQAGPQEMDQARRALLDLLAEQLGDQAHEATVVFDAPRAPKHVQRHYMHRGVQVRLSPRRQEADDLIEEQIAACRNPQTLTVVSSDHRLIQAAQRRGARALRTEELLAWLEERKQARPAAPLLVEERPEPSPDQVRQWLEEFGHLDRDPTLGDPMPFEGEDFAQE